MVQFSSTHSCALGILVRGQVPHKQKVVVMSKWYLDPKVSVRVTFRYNRLSPDAFEAAQVLVAGPLKLAEVKGLNAAVLALGYDLFEVAWLNLWWTEPGEEPSNCYYSLERNDDSMRVVKKAFEPAPELGL